MIRPLRLGLLLILVAVTSYYALLHFRVVRIAHPITQDEPGFVEITAAPNPYTHDGILTCASVYGPGYAWWARPFTAVVSNPYVAHRVASSCALLIMLGLLAWVLRREGVGGIETGVGVGIVYSLNVSSHSLAASADLLGAALYFASLMVSRRGTWPALLTGLALAALAAMTKPYFALAWVIVVAQLLLFGPPRKALAYLAVSGALALATAGIVRIVAPYLYFSTVGYHGTVSVRRFDALLNQSLEFGLLAGGVLLLALLVRPRKFQFGRILREPLLSPALDLWTCATLIAGAVLLGMLGWHSGNYLVYYYHLLLGPLVVVALRHVAAWPRVGRILLCANLVVLGWRLPPLPVNDGWDGLAASVAATKGPILADPLLEPFARSQSNVALQMHGQSASIREALEQLGSAVPAAYTDLQREFLQRAEIQAARIRAREYASIYVCYLDVGGGATWNYDQRHVLPALFAFYQPADEVVIYPYGMPYWNRMRHGQYPQHVVRWVPKSLPGGHD